jgi:hypothetical protein
MKLLIVHILKRTVFESWHSSPRQDVCNGSRGSSIMRLGTAGSLPRGKGDGNVKVTTHIHQIYWIPEYLATMLELQNLHSIERYINSFVIFDSPKIRNKVVVAYLKYAVSTSVCRYKEIAWKNSITIASSRPRIESHTSPNTYRYTNLFGGSVWFCVVFISTFSMYYDGMVLRKVQRCTFLPPLKAINV